VRTTSGSAERLQRVGGGWKLEFQQLVYNTPSLLRPRRFAVQGEQAILQQLREFPGHEPLAKDAERLFGRGALPDGAYVVRDGRWFPELRPDAMAELAAQPSEAAVASGRNALEELTKRVASLEALVRSLQEHVEEALQALAQGAVARARSQTHAAPVADSVAPRPGARSMRSSAMPLAATQSGVADDEQSRAAEHTPAIGLPAVAVLSDLVKSLAGPDALLMNSEAINWDQIATQQPVYCTPIQNHDGEEAGTMVFDLESALRMAAALLMEADEVVDALLEEKMMSDEMLDAASEVCNTLTSSFNKVSGNPHLRAGKMQPLTAARSAELANARKRDDYRYSRGGHLSMIAR
jgi:hypothetical protein